MSGETVQPEPVDLAAAHQFRRQREGRLYVLQGVALHAFDDDRDRRGGEERRCREAKHEHDGEERSREPCVPYGFPH